LPRQNPSPTHTQTPYLDPARFDKILEHFSLLSLSVSYRSAAALAAASTRSMRPLKFLPPGPTAQPNRASSGLGSPPSAPQPPPPPAVSAMNSAAAAAATSAVSLLTARHPTPYYPCAVYARRVRGSSVDL
jgi:hypothetical protein